MMIPRYELWKIEDLRKRRKLLNDQRNFHQTSVNSLKEMLRYHERNVRRNDKEHQKVSDIIKSREQPIVESNESK